MEFFARIAAGPPVNRGRNRRVCGRRRSPAASGCPWPPSAANRPATGTGRRRGPCARPSWGRTDGAMPCGVASPDRRSKPDASYGRIRHPCPRRHLPLMRAWAMSRATISVPRRFRRVLIGYFVRIARTLSMPSSRSMSTAGDIEGASAGRKRAILLQLFEEDASGVILALMLQS